jgi:hypothetical protein
VLSPSFPGWLAPLSFSPLRFAEFANFAAMLLASWVRLSCSIQQYCKIYFFAVAAAGFMGEAQLQYPAVL